MNTASESLKKQECVSEQRYEREGWRKMAAELQSGAWVISWSRRQWGWLGLTRRRIQLGPAPASTRPHSVTACSHFHYCQKSSPDCHQIVTQIVTQNHQPAPRCQFMFSYSLPANLTFWPNSYIFLHSSVLHSFSTWLPHLHIVTLALSWFKKQDFSISHHDVWYFQKPVFADKKSQKGQFCSIFLFNKISTWHSQSGTLFPNSF